MSAGNAEGLARLVVELSQTDRAVLAAMGEAGRTFYEEYFDKATCLKRLDWIMGLGDE